MYQRQSWNKQMWASVYHNMKYSTLRYGDIFVQQCTYSVMAFSQCTNLFLFSDRSLSFSKFRWYIFTAGTANAWETKMQLLVELDITNSTTLPLVLSMITFFQLYVPQHYYYYIIIIIIVVVVVTRSFLLWLNFNLSRFCIVTFMMKGNAIPCHCVHLLYTQSFQLYVVFFLKKGNVNKNVLSNHLHLRHHKGRGWASITWLRWEWKCLCWVRNQIPRNRLVERRIVIGRDQSFNESCSCLQVREWKSKLRKEQRVIDRQITGEHRHSSINVWMLA